MKSAEDGVETRLLEGKAFEAANDPVIAGVRPASGWDPFEVWRTRVRGTVQGAPTEVKNPTS